MQIFVTSIGGRTVSLEVEASATVASLKERLAEATGMAAADQRLFSASRLLEDASALSSVLSGDESCVEMRAAVRGGSDDADEDEDEECSPEQKFSIASYFITQSPPGEVDYVLNDVVKLVNDKSVLDEKNLNAIMKKHNEDNLVIADCDGKLALFSQYGSLGGGKYFDAANKRVLAADFQKKTFAVAEDAPPSNSFDAYREAIQAEVSKYLSTAYNLKKAARVTKKQVAAVFAADNGDININISALNSKMVAFWSGGWNSTYAFSVASKGSASCKCTIKVRVHTFESGNVQLISKNEVDRKITVGTPEATAKAVAKLIEQIETEYQGGMEEMYIMLAQKAFKKMRRILPVNQRKMDWRMAAHNVATQMNT